MPQSFMVVDGIQVVYDTVNYINQEQFTIAISKYDDTYMAQRFIEYYTLLPKYATTPKLLEEMRVRSNRRTLIPDLRILLHALLLQEIKDVFRFER